MKRLHLDMPPFAQIPVAREEFVFWADACVGLPYSAKGSFVEWQGDQPRGACNCYGLPFAVAEKCGLITDAKAFRKAFGRAVARHGEASTLRAFLGDHLWRERKTNYFAGDILLFRWNDHETYENEADAIRRARHHIAIHAGEDWVIHAVDTQADLTGQVMRSQLPQHDWNQLHQVWSLPQFALGLGGECVG